MAYKMTAEDMDSPRRDQGTRRQRLERWGTVAPTDADAAAGQQGAGEPASVRHQQSGVTVKKMDSAPGT